MKEENREQQALRELEALAAVSAAVNSSLEVEEVLNRALEEMVRVSGMEAGGIYLLDEAGEELHLIVHRGGVTEVVEQLKTHKLGQGLTGKAAAERRMIICPDLAKEFPGLQKLAEQGGISSQISFPLMAKGKLLGVLNLNSPEVHTPTKEELRVLQMINGQIAIGIENAKLYRETTKLQGKYQSLVENELVGVFIIQDDKLNYVNEGFCRISGYTEEELLESSPIELVHPEDRELIGPNIARRIQGEPLGSSFTFRGLRKEGQPVELEVVSRPIEYEGRPAVQGVLVDITPLKESERLRRSLLEVAERILASYDVEQILRRVVQAVVDHSPFQRAAIALYDLKHEPPIEGALVQAVAAGLTPEQEQLLYRSGGLPPEQRKQAFSERFRVSNSYYIPHDRIPWEPARGVPGQVSLDGWHPEDFLFIPLRGERGIIGHISVDDPRIPQAVAAEGLEPLEVFAGLAAVAVERATRMADLQQHKEWLHGSYQIGQQLTRYRSLEGLLNGILEILKRELHYDYGAVMLQQGNELVAEGVETALADRKIDLGDRISLQQGITGWVARTKRPALVNDVTQDPRYVMGHETIRSELAVPIQLGDELWGVINIESTERNRFKIEDQEFLSSVAAQLAVALAELRSREQLDRAYRIGSELAQIERVEELIDYVLEKMREQFKYDFGLVLLREGNRLKRVAQKGEAPRRKSCPDIRIGEGLTGWAAAKRESLLVNDVSADPRYIKGFEQTKAELAVPIYIQDELFGVLDIQSEQPDHFTEEDREMLESIAGQMAIAWSNIQRREKLKEASIRDPLTGLYNRRYFYEIIELEMERSRRYKHHLTLLMIDLDNFRRVNNTRGHRKGDELLGQIAQLLLNNVRASDMVFRYGGDEFLVLMPETDSSAHGVVGLTPRAKAAKAVERLQQAMEKWNRKSGLDFHVGLSIGVSSWSPDKKRRIEDILEEADRRMYQAKTMKGR